MIISNIIALPIANFAMSKWLASFAYRIDIGFWIFVSPSLLSFIIAMFTVIFQVTKAAASNPVHALKYE